jgi:hypothetical protein
MRNTLTPFRARTLPLGVTLAVGLMLGACARTTGDFGRRENNYWNNQLLPGLGLSAAYLRDEPLSLADFTDDEKELRNRAWRLVTPAHERAWFDSKLSELRYTRVLPLDVEPEPYVYFNSLTQGAVASVASRYRRLADDINADRALLGPFLATAQRVRQDDRIRARVLEAAADVSDWQFKSAQGRMQENAQLVNWVCASLRPRVVNYRYALEHLVIEGPMREAIPAERALMALESDPKTVCSPHSDLREQPVVTPHRGYDRRDLEGKILRREIPIAPEILPSGPGPAIEVQPLETRPLVTKG